MPSLAEIAEDYTALMATGDAVGAAEKYWAPNIAMIEPATRPGGSAAVVSGFLAARQKLCQWMEHNVMEDVMIDGPFITGDHFALFIDMEILNLTTGEREPFSEIAVYTVHGGLITEEWHFHE